MIFLYSRKSQLVLLLFWLIGMTIMYVQITGERPFWLVKATERITERREKARLGQAPVLPAANAAAPAPAASPARDPILNRCLELRVEQGVDGHPDTLVMEVDFVPALNKGFTVEKARGYYLEDAPTYVVTLGEPWTSTIGAPLIPGAMPQVASVNMIVSKSRHLRLLVHTKAMRIARGAKLHVSPTDKGIRVEVQLPH